MADIIKIVESLEKSGLLIDGAPKTVIHEIRKQKRWISWCYDGTYGSFIDITYGFFINACHIWKRSHQSTERTRKWTHSIISIAFNDKSYIWKRSTKIGR